MSVRSTFQALFDEKAALFWYQRICKSVMEDHGIVVRGMVSTNEGGHDGSHAQPICFQLNTLPLDRIQAVW